MRTLPRWHSHSAHHSVALAGSGREGTGPKSRQSPRRTVRNNATQQWSSPPLALSKHEPMADCASLRPVPGVAPISVRRTRRCAAPSISAFATSALRANLLTRCPRTCKPSRTSMGSRYPLVQPLRSPPRHAVRHAVRARRRGHAHIVFVPAHHSLVLINTLVVVEA